MNRKLVLSLLTALGHAPAADISDADLEIQATKIAATTHDLTAANAKISADLAEATNKQTALTADVERLNKEKATLAANVATLTTEKETLSTEKAAALSAQIAADKSRLAAANTASSLTLVAANSVVTAAVLTGRIPASEKDAKVKELIAAANFGEEAEKIARLTPRLKVVERFSANLDKTAALDAQDRQAKVHAAVNSHMKETGDTDYTKAFQAVKADPKNATLFAAMAQPAANA